jgi:hypothetical protein
MSTPLDARAMDEAAGSAEVAEYCRAIETYLCQKNDGHLVRIVGPSFDLVSAWATQGIPIKVAYRGIDRYVDRYYSKGPKRRPVRIDFCDADVLDVFDEWRRATGVTLPAAASAGDGTSDTGRRPSSLPAHLERALRRLTTGRATEVLDASFDPLLDRVSAELDRARSDARGLRGAAREELIVRLAAIDRELVETARARLDESTIAAIRRDADDELSGFRSAMSPEAFSRARGVVMDRLIRERAGLPAVAFI